MSMFFVPKSIGITSPSPFSGGNLPNPNFCVIVSDLRGNIPQPREFYCMIIDCVDGFSAAAFFVCLFVSLFLVPMASAIVSSILH